MKAPVKQIAENAGKTGEVIIADIQRANKDGYGYDALHDCYTNVIEDGIIDPVKVTKNALLNATSIASMLLTAEAAIVKKPEKQQPAIPPIM